MTHVFVVNERTFKYHLEYKFAGTGAGEKSVSFLYNPEIDFNSTTERMLVGMIADISRIRKGDNVIFYLQSRAGNQGIFFGVFKVASLPFFDENDKNNYLVSQTEKGLSFRVLLEPDKVYSEGITEHEYLDSLQGKKHPYDLCWSLIYRKLKANRGCTMITDYEFDDFLQKVKEKNKGVTLTGTEFTFNSEKNIIESAKTKHSYEGRQSDLTILPRLLYKANKGNAFETHLQAYLTKNIDNTNLSKLLIPYPGKKCWIGNEVSCGVGMQRIDLLIKQETETEVVLRLIELKYVKPYIEIATKQLHWYIEWLSYYMIPKYRGKKIRVIPTIIAKGSLSKQLKEAYRFTKYAISGASVEPLQYIGFTVSETSIDFVRDL